MPRHAESLVGIAAFVRTVEARSIAKAAIQLGVSAPAISRSLKRLEAALGVRLLHRTTRGIVPTTEGAVYFEQCRPSIDALRVASGVVRKSRGVQAGKLRVSSTVGFGRLQLVPALTVFAHKYPGIEIDLVLQDEFTHWVDDRIDVAIRNGRLNDSRVVARQLAKMELVVCGSPEYFVKHAPPQSPADLAQHNCINFRLAGTGRTFDWEFERDGRRFSQPVRGNLVVNDAESTCLAALSGAGLAQLGSYQAATHIDVGRLVPVLLDYVAGGRAHWICYLDRTHLPARIRALVDFLVAHFAEMDFAVTAPSNRPRKRRSRG